MHFFLSEFAGISNLIAAILCTVSSAVGIVALVLSGVRSSIIRLSALGAALGAVGGLAWVIAAIAGML